MPRLAIDLPASLPFTTVIPIRITDINYGGHLGNDAVLSLVHEARVRYLASIGYSELAVEGVSIIMSDAQIAFLSEGMYGEEIQFEVGVGELEGTRCTIFYRLTNRATGKELARVRTGIVFYDYGKKKVQPMPEGFRAKVK